MRKIDLRSDTVTMPTPEMREAMYRAEVGDDVYREDPTVNRLEEIGAAKVGKEAAVYVTSGTMGNAISVLSHTQRGDEVIFEADAHIYTTEVGGLAVMGGLIPRLVAGKNGILDPNDVDQAIRAANIHFPTPRLLCIENTHNRGGGTITPPQRMAELKAVARKHNMAVHLDGARVFNAAVGLGVDVKAITNEVDSVQFCLSKGLSAPIGSIVAGTKEWVEKARKYRKMLGGGMRQAGVIAAAGIVALEKMIDRLADDHANAKLLAEGLANIPGITVNMETVQTNIVAFDVAGTGLKAAEFTKALAQEGVLAGPIGATRIRAVTHYGIEKDDILETLKIASKVAKGA